MTECEVAIIGAGPGGIAAAYHLLQAGIDDFVMLDRAGDFGGSWRDNTYPGLEVDIPSLFYQFSFARTGRWGKVFAAGPDIHRYNLDVVEKYDLRRHLRPYSAVTAERWDADGARWELSIAGHEPLLARYVISAVGGYINTKPGPDIPGFDDFQGKMLRPNGWDHSYDYAGKNVAVIGTGSSGVQIAPAVAERAADVRVFQRTPAWIIPKPNPDVSERIQRLLDRPWVLWAINRSMATVMDAVQVLLFHLLPVLPESFLRKMIPLYDVLARR